MSHVPHLLHLMNKKSADLIERCHSKRLLLSSWGGEGQEKEHTPEWSRSNRNFLSNNYPWDNLRILQSSGRWPCSCDKNVMCNRNSSRCQHIAIQWRIKSPLKRVSQSAENTPQSREQVSSGNICLCLCLFSGSHHVCCDAISGSDIPFARGSGTETVAPFLK